MTVFFGVAALTSWLLLLTTLVMGYLGSSSHLLFALGATFLAISVHCLVFGIFTGAGKDTRELVQDLSLNPKYVSQTKSFRKLTFPPALYAILWILMTALMGGAVSVGKAWAPWVHGILAWITLAYNAKTFWKEFQAVKENAAILKEVNQVAAGVATNHPELQAVESFDSEEVIDGLGGFEWGSHVYALGKFLCFLGYNTWLPFLYMRFIMGMIKLSPWPFAAASLVFFVSGFYLRARYAKYRPQFKGLQDAKA